MSSATHADPEQSDPTSEPDVSCDLPDHHHTDDDDDDDEGSATGSPLSPAEAMQAAIAAGELSLSDVRSPRKASGNSRNLFLELESEDEGDTDAAAAAVAAAVKTCNHRGRTTRKLILSMTTMCPDSLSISRRGTVGALPAGPWCCPPAALALALVLTLRQCGSSAAVTAAPQLA